MAISLNANTTSGALIATKEVGGEQLQKVLIVRDETSATGGVSASNPLPVSISATVLVSGAITVSGSASVVISSIPAVSLTGSFVDATNNALSVSIVNDAVGIGGGTQYAEDAAHNSGDTGTMALAVRNDNLAALAGTDGDYTPLQVNATGALYTQAALPLGTQDVFNRVLTSHPLNQIDIQFFRDTPANLLGTVSANGTNGSAASNAGGALFSSSTDTNGEISGSTTETTVYRSGAEVYILFTAAWLDGGAATSYQRVGAYDANNGLFIGFENTSFGVTYRNNTSDTTVALASFSEDPLDGTGGSNFTRAGAPEALNTALLNVYRIRFGWLGSAPIYWEVLAPDGHWVTFHKTLFPNLQNTPSIRDADLEMRLHILKTAGAGNLRIQTDCWGAGVTIPASKLSDTVTNSSIAPLARTVLSAYNGSAYANIQSTAGGNLKVSVQEVSDGLDVGAGNAGTETQRVSIATDDVNLSAIKTAVELIDNAISGTEMQVDVITMPTTTITGVVSVTQSVTVVYPIAHDEAASGANPFLVGGEARTSNPTAVADGDLVRMQTDDLGRQVTHPFAPRDLQVLSLANGQTGVTLSVSTTVTLLAAGGAGVFRDLTWLSLSNPTANNATVTLRDGLVTGAVRGEWMLAANGGGLTISYSTPLKQTTANNGWSLRTDEVGVRAMAQAIDTV